MSSNINNNQNNSHNYDLPPYPAGSIEAIPASLAATIASTTIAAQAIENREPSSPITLPSKQTELSEPLILKESHTKTTASSEAHGFIKGASSSLVSTAATIPIDTIQQRKMTGEAGNLQEELRHIFRTYNPQFKTLVPAKIATGGVFLFTLNEASALASQYTNPTLGVVCGSLAATVAEQALSVPVGTITHEIRKGSASSNREAVSLIYRNSGVSGFYKGFALSTGSSAVFNTLLFPAVKIVREKLDETYPSSSQSLIQMFLVGGGVSTAIMPFTYPLFRVLIEKREGVEGSTLQVAKQIVNIHGIRGLYKGVGYSIPRNFVATGALFGTTALVENFLNGQPATGQQPVESDRSSPLFLSEHTMSE